MFRGLTLAAKVSAAAVAMAIVANLATRAAADTSAPVTGWLHYHTVTSADTDNVFNAATNSPTFGNGTSGNANNETVYGSFANQHLNPGDEITLTGQVQINRANITPGQAIPNGDIRFGIWNKVNPNVPQGTGWLGYQVYIASGNNVGNLEVRNPDDQGFNTFSFLSDPCHACSIATYVGPAPICAAGTTCNPDPLTTDNTNIIYRGTRLYIRLANANPTGNSKLEYNTTYNFAFHIARYGTGDYEVDANVVKTALDGDYNNDGTVNAADYTLWRDHLGTSYLLANRSPANTGDVNQADYDTWRSGFGQHHYSWSIGGGTDFDGVKPLVPGGDGTFTSHLSADYNRVGLLFGGSTFADSANLSNVQASTDTLQTLSLDVNTTTGAAEIANHVAMPLTINYYEISSGFYGDLITANWTGIDGTAASPPDGIGWDAAGGASSYILGEGNLTGSLTLNPGDSTISLGNIFNPATLNWQRDLRFFFALTNGTIVRGNVTYSSSSPGAGSGVPEPSSWALLLLAGLAAPALRRRL
jgi:hypothetical protein